MDLQGKHPKIDISRRDFLKKSALLAGGAIGIGLGTRISDIRAQTPGVAGNRVAWVHDGNATFWTGSGYYGDYVDQARVNTMIEKGIKELTRQSDSVTAWQQIIPDYTAGKKIAIKININNSSTENAIDATAAPIIGVIAGLKSRGVQESDIYVLEPSRDVSERIANPILNLYPLVMIWDSSGSKGNRVTFNENLSASTTIHHSHPDLANQYSYLPEQIAEANYLINMPIMKGHGVAIISLTFKNHFGSIEKWTCSKYHNYALPGRSNYSYNMNPMHDLYLNSNIKDKTVLIIGDGLFCSRKTETGVPEVWNSFGGEFPNSIFLSTDPVAIDSVMFDFLNAEKSRSQESQLYLHRAMELELGTHEHWDNSTDKLYSQIDFKKVEISGVPNPPTGLETIDS